MSFVLTTFIAIGLLALGFRERRNGNHHASSLQLSAYLQLIVLTVCFARYRAMRGTSRSCEEVERLPVQTRLIRLQIRFRSLALKEEPRLMQSRR